MTTTRSKTSTASDPETLDLPGMPAIPGLRARHVRDDADYARLAHAFAEANLGDGIPWLPTADQLRLDINGHDGIDPAADVILVEVDGEAVAEAQVWRLVRNGRVVFEVGGHVVPAYRRRGIGRALLTENIRRADERLALEPIGTRREIRGFAEDQEAGHRALLDEAGFELIRHFFLMRRPDLASLAPVELPDGLEIRPVTSDQHRAIFEAEREAFLDHWDFHEMGEDEFRTTYARPEIDTGLWVVAWDGDEVAGVVQTWIWREENDRLGVQRGWLEHISVRRQWRRRGLGRAITAAAMVRLREVGMTEAMLGVDSENPTGALGLYEGLGFEVDTRSAAYRLLD
jgi:mycothiol synthase